MNIKARFVETPTKRAFTCFKCRKPQEPLAPRIYDNDLPGANSKPCSYCGGCGRQIAAAYGLDVLVYSPQKKTENPDASTGDSLANVPAEAVQNLVESKEFQDVTARIAELERKEKVQAKYISEMLGRIATLEQQAKAAETERPWYLDTPPTPANNA